MVVLAVELSPLTIYVLACPKCEQVWRSSSRTTPCPECGMLGVVICKEKTPRQQVQGAVSR